MNHDPLSQTLSLTMSKIIESRNKRRIAELLKVQSCKLYNNKYMIASTQIQVTETFAFIAALVLTLLSCKVLFTDRKDNGNY